jgi:uncharacterized protein with HEPN domain
MENTNPNMQLSLKLGFRKATSYNVVHHKEFPSLYRFVKWTRSSLRTFNKIDYSSEEALDYLVAQADELESYIDGHDVASLKEATDLERMGLIGILATIGEKVRHISEAEQCAYPEIPWKSLQHVRNGIAHNPTSFIQDGIWDEMCRLMIEEFPKIKIHLDEMAEDYRIEALADQGVFRPQDRLDFNG